MAERCTGEAQVPREGMAGPDSPTRRRGTCPHCGKEGALTMSGHVRAHQPAPDSEAGWPDEPDYPGRFRR